MPIGPFLARLVLERPTFGVSIDLGFTILWLLSKWPQTDEAISFCELENVVQSLKKYLSICKISMRYPYKTGKLDNEVIFRPLPKSNGKFGDYWEIMIDKKAAEKLQTIADFKPDILSSER